LDVERVKLYVSESRVTEASACLTRLDRLVAEYPAPVRCAWSEIGDYRQLAHAHVALAKHEAEDAVLTLRALRAEAVSTHRSYFCVRLDTLLAIALLDAGEPIKATETLRSVVTVGAEAGLYRTIIDTDPKVGLLLRRLRENVERKADSGQLLSHVDHLLDGWRMLYQPDGSHRHGGLTDSLTPRTAFSS
jgi:LuxR family maltose regulon positive regulatory protein